MTTSITERDKKLLAGLSLFCAMLLFVMLVIRPLGSANAAMGEQIEENKERIRQVEQKDMQFPELQAENLKLKSELNQVQIKLYPILKSQEIDRLLTDKVISYGLSARRLQIVMPDEAANVTRYKQGDDDGSNPDFQDGVWIAHVGMDVSGSIASIDRLIDELSAGMQGVCVTGISWSRDRYSGEGMDSYDLSLQLQILMSRRE